MRIYTECVFIFIFVLSSKKKGPQGMEHSSQNRLSGPVSLRPVAFLDIIFAVILLLNLKIGRYAIALHHFTHLLFLYRHKNDPSSFGGATLLHGFIRGIIGIRLSEKQIAVRNAIVLGNT